MSNDKKNTQPQAGIRLQKFLSLAGITSRRHAEEMIEQGRVKISGRVVTEMGVHVIPGKSRVEVDNKPVFYSEERNYVLFHKPSECITTLDDPEQRTTVIDLLPKSMPRVFPVGRLDWDTEGLLLLTNDGELAYRLTHPAAKVPRVYHAKVRGELKDTSPEFKKLAAGVELEDGLAKPDRLSIVKFTGNNTWIEIELHIGRNRIVRRMCDAVGYPVMKLRRVAFGNLSLDGLALGAYRDLSEAEVAELYSLVGEDMNMPSVRSKSGVRYARGFDPKERTMPRQAAPAREDLDKKDKRPAKKSHNFDDKPIDAPRRSTLRFSDKSEKSARRPREDARFEHDTKRSFNASWDKQGNDDRSERKSFPRNDDRSERKSFPRNDDRSERKSFPRNDDRSERKSFPRNDDRSERKSFPRNDDRSERKSFPRNDDRSERKSFPRNDDRSERKSFPRNNERDERKSFNREENRGDRKSFRRDDDRNDRKSFRRDEPRHEKKSIVRDEHGGEKKRPFARGVKPRGSRSSR